MFPIKKNNINIYYHNNWHGLLDIFIIEIYCSYIMQLYKTKVLFPEKYVILAYFGYHVWDLWFSCSQKF